MRKIEREMCAVVKERRNWKCGNTQVTVVGGCRMHVYLHGSLIAVVNEDMSGMFTLAGWGTQITRSRCRALGADTAIMRRNKNGWFNF